MFLLLNPHRACNGGTQMHSLDWSEWKYSSLVVIVSGYKYGTKLYNEVSALRIAQLETKLFKKKIM